MNLIKIMKIAGLMGGLFLLPLIGSHVEAGTITTPEYWQAVEKATTPAENSTMTPQEIQQLNESIRQRASSLRDLSSYPTVLDRQQVQQRIYAGMQDYWQGDRPTVYTAGHLLTDDEWKTIRADCNIDGLSAEVTIRYAVTTQRGNIRLLPSDTAWSDSPDSSFDRLQGTAIDPAQPVAVLAASLDGQFVYVESGDYQGWLDVDKLAFTDRNTWLEYVRPADFAVVTDHKKTIIAADGQKTLYQMGAVIPCIIDHNGRIALKLPARTDAGMLTIHNTPAQFDHTLHIGYLPYSADNVIHQAFSFLGDVYGWGGLEDSVDCSAFVQDIYRSMGIHIPRDADQQELSLPVKMYDLTKARLGNLIFKPGHVMMYLGKDADGMPMVIHASSAYHQVMVAKLADVTSQISSVGSIR